MTARLVATDGSVLRTGGWPADEEARRMSAILHGPLLWYLNRSTGLVLLALLTVTTVLGVLATGRGGRLLPRFVGQALHRNLALWSVVLLVLHVTTAVVDTYVDIRWWQAVVPWDGVVVPAALARPRHRSPST